MTQKGGKETTYISRQAALAVLTREGEFTETQARIVLNHAHGIRIDGADYYPLRYISERARHHAAKPD